MRCYCCANDLNERQEGNDHDRRTISTIVGYKIVCRFCAREYYRGRVIDRYGRMPAHTT